MGPFDENGVPMYNPKMFNQAAEICYHPTVVTQYGFARYNRWIELGEESDYKEFKICANWLANNTQKRGQKEFAVWLIPFGVRTPRIPPNWVSAITQGQGLSLLLRLYVLEPSNLLKTTIQNIANSFYFTLREGGVITKMTKERYFLQEAGDICILNGCIAALVGLLEYLEVFSNK